MSFESRLAGVGRRLDDAASAFRDRARGMREGVGRTSPLRGARERAGRLAARAREAAEIRPSAMAPETRTRLTVIGAVLLSIVATVFVTLRLVGGPAPISGEEDWRALRSVAAARDAQGTAAGVPRPIRASTPATPEPKRSK